MPPDALKPYVIEVSAEYAGQRLDNFLLRELKGVPRSWIYRIVRRGEVRINRGRVRPDYRLRSGDAVRIPPLRQAASRTTDHARDLTVTTLYEDEDLLVLDKPAGLPVHSGSSVSSGLIEQLRAQRPGQKFLELAHRLDRATSGCLVVAKRRGVLTALHADWRANSGRKRYIDKRYLALVKGPWQGGSVTVDAPLSKNTARGGERLTTVAELGRYAKSILHPQRRFATATLLEIELLTGRTHQARAHAAHIGHPLAGDEKYGDHEFNRGLKDLGLRRLFLHASRLRFRHPRTAQRLDIQAPLPVELDSLLDRLAG